MSVIVIGTGRSGTNIALEMLALSPDLKASQEVENKQFSALPQKYPDNYLTKCDTYYLTWVNLMQVLNMHPNMKIVFTIRDARDICMSKLYRGQPGNDTLVLSKDATINGCLDVMKHMYEIYRKIYTAFAERMYIFHMGKALGNSERLAQEMCNVLDVAYNPEMEYFYKYMRNPYKKKRYAEGIDYNQLHMWRFWKTMYGGFFVDYPMEELFNAVNYINIEFGYIK